MVSYYPINFSFGISGNVAQAGNNIISNFPGKTNALLLWQFQNSLTINFFILIGKTEPDNVLAINARWKIFRQNCRYWSKNPIPYQKSSGDAVASWESSVYATINNIIFKIARSRGCRTLYNFCRWYPGLLDNSSANSHSESGLNLPTIGLSLQRSLEMYGEGGARVGCQMARVIIKGGGGV